MSARSGKDEKLNSIISLHELCNSCWEERLSNDPPGCKVGYFRSLRIAKVRPCISGWPEKKEHKLLHKQRESRFVPLLKLHSQCW